MRIPVALVAILTTAGCATGSAGGPASSVPTQNGSSQGVTDSGPPTDDDVLVGRCSSEWGPTVLPDALAEARRGSSTARFSELQSSTDQAVQVCDVRGQVEWLTRVRCDDGSNPFASLEAAHESRTGNVGPGGPCGHIIDLYEVPCPERTYEVYMDLYVCAQSELR